MSESGTCSTSGSSCGGSSSVTLSPGMPGSCGRSASALIAHLAALDGHRLVPVDGDPQASVAIDHLGGTARPVHAHAPAAEEVARAEVRVDRLEPAREPLRVAAL